MSFWGRRPVKIYGNPYRYWVSGDGAIGAFSSGIRLGKWKAATSNDCPACYLFT